MERSSRSSSFCGCDGHSTESSFLDQPSVRGGSRRNCNGSWRNKDGKDLRFVCLWETWPM